MVRLWGEATIEGLLFLRTIVRSLPTGGMKEAVITPVLEGIITRSGGSKLSLDEVSVIPVLAAP